METYKNALKEIRSQTSQINIIDKYITDIYNNIIKPDLKSIAVIRNVAYNLLLINITLPYVLKKVYTQFLLNLELLSISK